MEFVRIFMMSARSMKLVDPLYQGNFPFSEQRISAMYLERSGSAVIMTCDFLIRSVVRVQAGRRQPEAATPPLEIQLCPCRESSRWRAKVLWLCQYYSDRSSRMDQPIEDGLE